MTLVDRWLQQWRMKAGLRWLENDIRVIDVGAHEGELFDALGGRLRLGFGIEPLSHGKREAARFRIESGLFPAVRPSEKEWDAITMFAVLEHIPRTEQAALADACFELLRVGGRVVITVPATAVDHILGVLRSLGVVEGMSLEQHFGFEPAETLTVFSPPRFRLLRHRRFQLGLNHLFVFEKVPNPSPGPAPQTRRVCPSR